MNICIKIYPSTLIALSVAACGQTQKVATESPDASPAAPAAPAAFAQGPTAKGTALGDLTAIATGFNPQRGSIKVDTKVYESSVFASFGCTGGANWDFDLNREYTKLSAIVGVDDYSVADEQVKVEFLVDDQPRGEANVKLGTAQPIEVDVTNGLRLRVEYTRDKATCEPTTGFSTNVVLADATLTK
jgi:hypothetical protein